MSMIDQQKILVIVLSLQVNSIQISKVCPSGFLLYSVQHKSVMHTIKSVMHTIKSVMHTIKSVMHTIKCLTSYMNFLFCFIIVNTNTKSTPNHTAPTAGELFFFVDN